MGRMRAFVARHRASAAVAGFVFVGLVVFVLVWFQPQKLFIDKTVNEAAPSEAAVPTPATTQTATPATPSASPSAVFGAPGAFRSLEHKTTGTARLIRQADGSILLRFENLDTSNGPDLRVYLSMEPPDRGQHDYAEGFIDLGALKGNVGNQNYAVPSGTDPSTFHSAVIWCRRFKVGFGVAPVSLA